MICTGVGFVLIMLGAALMDSSFILLPIITMLLGIGFSIVGVKTYEKENNSLNDFYDTDNTNNSYFKK